MDRLNYQDQYERNLPHFQPPGAILFVTFRLVGSLPATVIDRLRAEAVALEKRLARMPDNTIRREQSYEAQRRRFGRWDAALDSDQTGPHWLRDPEVAGIIAEALHYRDGRVYDLDCYTIMSNHVHVVFAPLRKEQETYHALASIMHSLKGNTANKANKILGRSGQFWQHESYDHIVRDEAELIRIRRYVRDNPVKAELVTQWQDWPWTYVKSAPEETS